MTPGGCCSNCHVGLEMGHLRKMISVYQSHGRYVAVLPGWKLFRRFQLATGSVSTSKSDVGGISGRRFYHNTNQGEEV